MLGASAGNASDGKVSDGSHAWTDFSWDHWSWSGEFGYAPTDFLGLGSGIYRVQPFVAEKGGPSQGGVCFNFQQRLGPHSPFGWFGRFGFGGAEVTSDAAAEVATGFVMQAPLKYAGLVPRLSNDLLGIGFVWSQPSATTKTIYHENEYILESFYTLQLTPTMRLQPDLQVIWNPAFNPDLRPGIGLPAPTRNLVVSARYQQDANWQLRIRRNRACPWLQTVAAPLKNSLSAPLQPHPDPQACAKLVPTRLSNPP